MDLRKISEAREDRKVFEDFPDHDKSFFEYSTRRSCTVRPKSIGLRVSSLHLCQ